jgi:hypothetical protein
MMRLETFLPARSGGRGTIRRMVERYAPSRQYPSTTLRVVPLAIVDGEEMP